MDNSTIWILIDKKLKGMLSAEEEAGLSSWVSLSDQNRELFDQYAKLWKLTNPKQDAAFAPDEVADWDMLKSKISQYQGETVKEPKVLSLFSTTAFYRAAAVLLVAVFIGIILFFSNTGNDVTAYLTNAGQEKTVLLPDSSKISLKENTTLYVLPGFNEEQRVVSLSGEAFFDIRRNEKKRFIIYGGNAVTEVLGTSFYVRAYQNEAKTTVTVVTGKVAFFSSGNKDNILYLLPGDKASLLASGELVKENAVLTKPQTLSEEKEKNNTNKEILGNLKFNDVPMIEVLMELEDFYKVSFDSPAALDSCRFTGTFVQCNIENVMGVIGASLDISYKRSGDRITIKGKGCSQ